MSSTRRPIRWVSSAIRRITSVIWAGSVRAPCWCSSALASSDASGVRSSWLASAKNWRICSWLASRSCTVASILVSMPFSAPPSRPTSLRGLCGATRSDEVARGDPVGLRGHRLDRPQAAAEHQEDPGADEQDHGRRADHDDALDLDEGVRDRGQAGTGDEGAAGDRASVHQVVWPATAYRVAPRAPVEQPGRRRRRRLGHGGRVWVFEIAHRDLNRLRFTARRQPDRCSTDRAATVPRSDQGLASSPRSGIAAVSSLRACPYR